MHDIDRTQLEAEESESDLEAEEESDSFLNELLGEIPAGLAGEADEVEEMELASELLEVSNEEEFEEFLGKLVSRAWRGAQGIAKGPVGQQVKQAVFNHLKGVGKGLLPGLGKTVGAHLGPGGSSIGEGLGTAAQSKLAQAFGLELEGLSNEDREFEAAKAFVRFAKCAARNASGKTSHSRGGAPPKAIARAALSRAAQRGAPGLQRSGAGGSRRVGRSGGWSRTGLWERRGNTIVLHI